MRRAGGVWYVFFHGRYPSQRLSIERPSASVATLSGGRRLLAVRYPYRSFSPHGKDAPLNAWNARRNAAIS